MTRLAAFVILGSMLWGGAWAQGDATAGAGKIITCAACHGQDGQSMSPLYPSIGGQNYRYLFSQLRAMKAHAGDPDARGNRIPGRKHGEASMFIDQRLYYLPTP